MSGFAARINSTASLPSPASPAISTSCALASKSAILCRASTSSSTMATRIVFFSDSIRLQIVRGVKRQSDLGEHAAAIRGTHRQRTGVTIQLFQTLLRVAQADTALRCTFVEAGSVVAHREHEVLAFAPRRDLDTPLAKR